jgi:hypothetical protein
MTSLPTTEQTRTQDAVSCDCGCVCCGPSDLNSAPANTSTNKSEKAADPARCGCGCSN